MEKLELKHIAQYLPYGLYIAIQNTHTKEKVYYEKLSISNLEVIENKYYNVKLVLRPLSDLLKEIEIKGEKFVPIEILVNICITELNNSNLLAEHTLLRLTNKNLPIEYKINHTPYVVMQKLFEWHFDVFCLIDKGLAVDYNTVFPESDIF